jgi:hypothetical protein
MVGLYREVYMDFDSGLFGVKRTLCATTELVGIQAD